MKTLPQALGDRERLEKALSLCVSVAIFFYEIRVIFVISSS
jgi:hypothetical protein